MSFFTSLIRSQPKKKRTAIVIEADERSVGGAYVFCVEGELPVIVYAHRSAISPHAKAHPDQAVAHALSALAETMIREGAPSLGRMAGSARADDILLSIGEPWQKTVIRTSIIERKEPFVFTPEIVSEKLRETAIKLPGKTLVNESIIGTVLNGYQTNDPYGEETRRAAVTALTSFAGEEFLRAARAALRSAFHASELSAIANDSLRAQAMCEAFPHERDAIIVDTAGAAITVALVRRGLIAAIEEVRIESAETKRDERIIQKLAELGRSYPLPRTVFLLPGRMHAETLLKTIEKAHKTGVWPWGSAPKAVVVQPGHFTGLARHAAESAPDLPLILMALFWRKEMARL